MQSQNVRFVAELVRHSGVLSDSPVLLLGDQQEGLEAWFSERGVEVASVPDVDRLRELDPGSYAFVVGDRQGALRDADALEQLRRVAGSGVILTAAANGSATASETRALPEIERFFFARGDRVMVIDDVLVALRADPAGAEIPGAQPAGERLALLSVCLAQAAVASAAGRRLDVSTAEAAELRDRLRLAEDEIEELSAKLAQALNALDDERREHAELSERVRGWRSSRAWPILVVSYNVVHAGRVLRSRWARRRARRLGRGDG